MATTPATPYVGLGDDNFELKAPPVRGVVVQQQLETTCETTKPKQKSIFIVISFLLMAIVAATTTLAIFFALRKPEAAPAPLEIVSIMQSTFDDTFFKRLSKLVIFNPQSQLELSVTGFVRTNGGLCGSKAVLLTDHGDLEIDHQTFTMRNTNETFDSLGFALSKGPDFVLLGTPKLEAHLKAGAVWQWSPCVSTIPEAPSVIPTLPSAFELKMVIHTSCSKETFGGPQSCYLMNGLPRPGFVVVDGHSWIQEKQHVISDFPRFQRIETMYPHSPDFTLVDVVSCDRLAIRFQEDSKSKNNYYCEFSDKENNLCKNATDSRAHPCVVKKEDHPVCYMRPTGTKFDGNITVGNVPFYKFTFQDYSLGADHAIIMEMFYNMEMELVRMEFPETDQWVSVTEYRTLTPSQIDASLFSMPICKDAPLSVPRVEETSFPPEPLAPLNNTTPSDSPLRSKMKTQAYKKAFPGTGCGALTILPIPVIPFRSGLLPYSMELATFPNGGICSFQFTAPNFPVVALPCPGVDLAGEVYFEADTGYRNLYAEGCALIKISCGVGFSKFKINLVNFDVKMCAGIGSTDLHGVKVLMIGLGGEAKLTLFSVVEVKVYGQLFFVPYNFPPAVSKSPHLRIEVGVSASVKVAIIKLTKSWPLNLPASDWYHLR